MVLEEFQKTGLFRRVVHDQPLRDFQVLGERASATNLVRKLIEKNVQIHSSDAMGWKHATPHMVAIPADFLVVGVVRDAESWALSMHKRPWHLDPRLQVFDFSRFIRTPWRGIVDRPTDFEELKPKMRDRSKGLELQLDRHPITGQPYANLFQMRSIKLASLLGLLNRNCNVALVRAEVVQADPEAFVTWFRQAFNLEAKQEKFLGVGRRMGNRHKLAVPAAVRGETPKQMSEPDRAYMRQALDLQLEALIGYDYAEAATGDGKAGGKSDAKATS